MKRKVYRNPVLARTFDMIVSSAIVYLITPALQKTLAPLQAQLNADAINSGQTPTEKGLSQVANPMVKIETLPAGTPVTENTPAILSPQGLAPIIAIVDTMTDNRILSH